MHDEQRCDALLRVGGAGRVGVGQRSGCGDPAASAHHQGDHCGDCGDGDDHGRRSGVADDVPQLGEEPAGREQQEQDRSQALHGALAARLLVTPGFRDMLEIARERKYDLYDIGIDNPPPLVPRNLRLEVTERTRADGNIAEPLDEAQLLRQFDALRDAGCTSIALVFLHAYANPTHEIAAAHAIAATSRSCS